MGNCNSTSINKRKNNSNNKAALTNLDANQASKHIY